MVHEKRASLSFANLKQTMAFGRRLGAAAQAGDVILLKGDLGAGKTTLTQAIGNGLGVDEQCYITSPTFSLLHEYAGRLPLYHMDLYRLSSEEEIEEVGFEEYIYGQGLTVIEWPERLGDLTPADYLQIHITRQSPQGRKITVTAHGAMVERLVDFIKL